MTEEIQQRRPIRPGGRTPITDLTDVEVTLNKSLLKLAAGEGPTFKIANIHSATKQIVCGSRTEINADLTNGVGETKEYRVIIWSQPWLPDGIQVTFQCEGEPEIVRKHSP
ncbi:sarcocystatin-A-like [Musca domestica]|uniref:Cystatin B2 n=1 Tax=Musca domestica TaxID=7370 RepID=G3GJ64_MUSDO|nr:sarcocystatin-A-like [Musca domestica]AEO50698.1 cystatin B2 [Musca domestica]